MADLTPPVNRYPAMTALALKFPTLRSMPVDPWDPVAFDAAARGLSHGAQCSAAFVLSVWSGSCGAHDIYKRRASDRLWVWKTRRFDLQDALTVWDSEHRDAFLSWARAPWWL